METIVLDYEKGETTIISHNDNIDAETMLFSQMNYNESAIEWMTVESVSIAYKSLFDK